MTYEFENVDLNALKDVADKVKIPQGTNLLYITKHRLREKNFLRSAGCMTAPYLPVKNMAELKDAIKKIGYNCVLKTCEGGYDGHGQEVLKSDADLENKILKIMSISKKFWLQETAFLKAGFHSKLKRLLW